MKAVAWVGGAAMGVRAVDQDRLVIEEVRGAVGRLVGRQSS